KKEKKNAQEVTGDKKDPSSSILPGDVPAEKGTTTSAGSGPARGSENIAKGAGSGGGERNKAPPGQRGGPPPPRAARPSAPAPAAAVPGATVKAPAEVEPEKPEKKEEKTEKEEKSPGEKLAPAELGAGGLKPTPVPEAEKGSGTRKEPETKLLPVKAVE